MAAKSDITVKVTADTAQAQAGLTQLGGATKGLQGIVGNLMSKVPGLNRLMGPDMAAAGATGAAGMANMAAAGIAAAGALVAFGVKAVDAFTSTAKAAIDGAAATGLSTEQFSRWAAAADDAEVSAEQFATGVGKIAKDLDAPAWQQYGIATRDAAGNARAANDILLDAFDALGQIENETARAAAGNDLFGKSYANLAPLIGKSREEYEGMLSVVEDGQVITAAEAEKAEEMRLAQDALADALHEVSLEAGAALAELAPLLNLLAKAMPGLSDAAIGQSFGRFTKFLADIQGLGRATQKSAGVVVAGSERIGDGMELIRLKQRDLNAETVELHERLWKAAEISEVFSEAQRILAEQIEIVARAEEEESRETKERAEVTDRLNEKIRDRIELERTLYREAQDRLGIDRDMIDTLYGLADSAKEYNDKLADGNLTFEETVRLTHDMGKEYIDAAAAFADAEGAADGTKASIDLQVASLQSVVDMLAPGSPLRVYLEEYIAQLAAIPTSVNTTLGVNGSALPTGPMGTREVTPTGSPGYRGRGETVGNTTIVNYFPGAPTPSQVDNAQREYERVNVGPIP